MDQLLSIMLPPLVACLILTGIHAYLGLHVVSRGVIFVDLALAQIAALGSTFAFLAGFQPESQMGYYYSLGFTFLGAAIFALSRLRDQRVPQEALIGIVFAVASSAAILIADRAPAGAEHVEQMLTGSILWVSWPMIGKTFVIYCIIGLFHFLYRKRFLFISMHSAEAEASGMAVRWWDFLFYISFGFVITSSVAIAGVLLVFCYLIVPSVIGMIFSARIGLRLAIGWASGILVSLLGLYLSYRFDLPSGPSIVCTFGAVLICAALARYVVGSENKTRALVRTASGSLGLAILLLLALQISPYLDKVPQPEPSDLEKLERALAQLGDGETVADETLALLRDLQKPLQMELQSGRLQPDYRAVQNMGTSGRPEFIPILLAIHAQAQDPWLKYYASDSLTQLGHKEAFHQLITILRSPTPPFLRSQILEKLVQVTDDDFGYDPAREAEANEAALNRLEVWWHQNTERMVWDKEGRIFRVP